MADGIECIVEGELLNLVEILLLEVRGGHVVVGIDKREDVLEHTAGSAAGGHEFHHAVALGLVLFPGIDECLALFGCGRHDAVAHGCCGLESQEGETGCSLMKLCLNLRCADATCCNLLQVFL